MKAAVLLALLAAAAVVPAARACRYCQQAADPVEVMRFQGQGRNAGSFPVDDSLNNFGNGAPAAPVAAPTTAPDPATLVTNAAALPARPPVVVPAAPVAPAPVVVVSQPPIAVVSPPRPVTSVRWADFGLLGLMGAGGLFAWRTRAARPVAA